MNRGPFAAFGSGGSSVTSGSSKAAEAQLLTQATSTAIVAARSILLSGGSEDVALKTAKAAAQSVLNPSSSDGDTISGKSTAGGFLRRRRMRRHAEVVASMALVAAVNDIRNGMNSDWSDSHPSSHMNPYTRNITTRSMHTADEPSVLSGSTRPLGGPSQSAHSRTLLTPQTLVLTENNGKGMLPPSGKPIVGPPISAHVSSLSKETSQDEDIPSENIDPSATSKHANMAREKAKLEQKAPLMDNPIYMDHSGDKDDNAAGHKMDPLATAPTEGDYDDETTIDPSVWTNARNNPWKDFDPLLSSVTEVFNLLTCGPIPTKQSHGSSNFTGTVPKRIAHHAHYPDYDTIGSAIDTMDTRDDGNTEFRSEAGTDFRSDFRTMSSGESSVDSYSILRDMQSNDASEGDIQVRSSIRDTMENLVSKTQKGIQNELQNLDQQWRSYEVRETIRPSTPSSNANRKPLRVFAITPKGVKKPFFFNRRGMKNTVK